MTTTFSRKEALSYGWNKMKENLSLFIGLGLITLLIGGLQGSFNRMAREYSYGSFWLTATVLQVIQVFISMGWIRIALRLHDGQKAGYEDLVSDLSLFFNYLIATVLYGLIVAAGTILLVVPGVIWAVKYGLYGFAVVDQKLDPVDALRRSAALTEGVKSELFVFGLLLIGVNIVGAMAMGIGLLATIPTTCLAAAYVYRRLAARALQARPSQPVSDKLGRGDDYAFGPG